MWCCTQLKDAHIFPSVLIPRYIFFSSLPPLLWCILQIWIVKQPLCCNNMPVCRISTTLSDPAGLLLADALLVKILLGLCRTSRNRLGWLKYLKLTCFTNHTVTRLWSAWMLKLSSLFRVKVRGCWPPARLFCGTVEILTFYQFSSSGLRLQPLYYYI